MYLLWPYAQILSLFGNLRNYDVDLCIISETLDLGTCKPIEKCSVANELVGIGSGQSFEDCSNRDGLILICCPDSFSMTHNRHYQRANHNYENPTKNKMVAVTLPATYIPKLEFKDKPTKSDSDKVVGISEEISTGTSAALGITSVDLIDKTSGSNQDRTKGIIDRISSKALPAPNIKKVEFIDKLKVFDQDKVGGMPNVMGSEISPPCSIPLDEISEEQIKPNRDGNGRIHGRPTSKWPAKSKDPKTNSNTNKDSLEGKNSADYTTLLDMGPVHQKNNDSLENRSETDSKLLNSDLKTSATEYPKYTQKCTDKTTGYLGVCKPFDDCSSSVDPTDDVTLCGFTYDVPTICCIENVIDEDIIIFPNDDSFYPYGYKYGLQSTRGDRTSPEEDNSQTEEVQSPTEDNSQTEDVVQSPKEDNSQTEDEVQSPKEGNSQTEANLKLKER